MAALAASSPVRVIPFGKRPPLDSYGLFMANAGDSAQQVADGNGSVAPDSIFREYYREHNFVDRFETDRSAAVDVIIPVIHTNELWKANLFSLYREIPIHKLFIGDGGCIDNSIDVVKKFPRVEILDHRAYKTLGYSLRKLIEAVEADWFIYVHSDVY